MCDRNGAEVFGYPSGKANAYTVWPIDGRRYA
jgi:hypothetical protein